MITGLFVRFRSRISRIVLCNLSRSLHGCLCVHEIFFGAMMQHCGIYVGQVIFKALNKVFSSHNSTVDDRDYLPKQHCCHTARLVMNGCCEKKKRWGQWKAWKKKRQRNIHSAREEVILTLKFFHSYLFITLSFVEWHDFHCHTIGETLQFFFSVDIGYIGFGRINNRRKVKKLCMVEKHRWKKLSKWSVSLRIHYELNQEAL